jgi:hypothetical protein
MNIIFNINLGLFPNVDILNFVKSPIINNNIIFIISYFILGIRVAAESSNPGPLLQKVSLTGKLLQLPEGKLLKRP